MAALNVCDTLTRKRQVTLDIHVSDTNTVNLGYSVQVWDQPKFFTIIGICYNRVG
jgi:hypothetical protein